MNIFKLTDIFLLRLRKPVFAVVLLCCCNAVQAQYEDTIYTEEKKVTIDEATGQEDSDQQNDYFLSVTDYDSLLVLTRTVPDSIRKLFGKDDAYWYSYQEVQKGKRSNQPRRNIKNGDQRIREEESAPPSTAEKKFSSPPWLRSLMWIIIIGGFAGALAWYLANNNVVLFRKKAKKLADETEEGELPENIFAINYQQEIDRAAAQGNYRLAIRLMYLRVLRNLAERNLIQYKQDKTNFDYLMQLQPTALYKDFFRITRHYEYSWYGEFNVSQAAYTIIRQEFDQFDKTTG